MAKYSTALWSSTGVRASRPSFSTEASTAVAASGASQTMRTISPAVLRCTVTCPPGEGFRIIFVSINCTRSKSRVRATDSLRVLIRDRRNAASFADASNCPNCFFRLMLFPLVFFYYCRVDE